MRYLLLTIALLAAIASVTHGHGFGQTLEKAIGDFVIDVDYDALELRAGEPARFNFNIWNKDRTQPSEFTDVWVRIAPQNTQGVVFAGSVHNPEFGFAGFTYTFPRSGFYELAVRFQKNGEQLAEEVSFPLTVTAGETQEGSRNWRDVILGIVIGLIIGFSLALAFFKRKTT